MGKGRSRKRGNQQRRSFLHTSFHQHMQSTQQDREHDDYKVEPVEDMGRYKMVKAFMWNIPPEVDKYGLQNHIEQVLQHVSGPTIWKKKVVGCFIFYKSAFLTKQSKECALVTLADDVYFKALLQTGVVIGRRRLRIQHDRNSTNATENVPSINIANMSLSDEVCYHGTVEIGNMLDDRTVLWQWNHTAASLHFDFSDRCLYVIYSRSQQQLVTQYRIRLLRSKLRDVSVFLHRSSGKIVLVFSTFLPPFMEQNASDLILSLLDAIFDSFSKDVTSSTTEATNSDENDPKSHMETFDRSFSRTVDSLPEQVHRRCQTIKFTIDPGLGGTEHVLRYLKSFGLVEKTTKILPSDRIPTLTRELRCKVNYQQVDNAIQELVRDSVDENVQYWLACLSSTKMDLITLYASEFLTEDVEMRSQQRLTSLLAWIRETLTKVVISIIFHVLQNPVYKILRNPVAVFAELQEQADDLVYVYESFFESNPSTIFTKRVYITPLREVVRPPEPDMSNRVIKDYQAWNHRFLRVTVLDEHFGALQQASSEIFDKRILGIFRDGFSIYGRCYQFLACSISQLRERSCWFYNASPGHSLDPSPCPSAEQIRQPIGDLSQIVSPWKFNARLGQGFSSALASLSLPPEKHREMIDDQFSLTTGQCYSDGVGTITFRLAAEIASVMKLSQVPSAFQIRYGGSKGVLSVLHPAITGEKVSVRPSMTKFVSDHPGLFILSYAKPIPFYLNRQIIPILSHAGVRDDVFMSLLDDMLGSIVRALQDEAAAEALLLTHQQSIFDIHCPTSSHDEIATDGHDVNLLTPFSGVRTLMQALKSGFKLKDDLVLHGSMLAVCKRLLLDLQLKARIYVPKAIVLMGIIDETGSLREGEVFVQIQQLDITNSSVILQQRVAVGRNPSLYPGDIRVLQAVDAPALRHLVNVAVFPACGAVPVQSMMSGGDLDGDLYFVIHDNRLIPSPARVPAPMDYHAQARQASKAKANQSTDNVTIDDIIKCVVDYMKNDNLGVIATLHVAYADLLGIDSSVCLELAKLHSISVDYPKTGVPAALPPESFHGLSQSGYPDFMEHRKSRYKSEKVLGQIYRTVVKLSRDSTIEITEMRATADPALCLPDAESYFDEALDCMDEYNASLLQLMTVYDITNELELFTGFICKFARSQTKTKGQDVQNRVRTLFMNLRREFTALFWEEFGIGQKSEQRGGDEANAESNNSSLQFSQLSSEMQQRALRKASAWYCVCYDKRHNDSGLYSFAWIPWQMLCKLKAEQYTLAVCSNR